MKHAIAPYLQNKACILQLPKHSDGRVHAILLIDAWPTHLTESFRSWMKHEYPWIHVAFVPANCTPIAQPADCGLVSAINQLPLAGFDAIRGFGRQARWSPVDRVEDRTLALSALSFPP